MEESHKLRISKGHKMRDLDLALLELHYFTALTFSYQISWPDIVITSTAK